MTEYVRVPREPTEAVLRNMAIRSDHGLGCPGYYDQPIFGGEGVGHARRLEAALTTMRQLYEEVVLAASPQVEGSSADDIGHELIAFANQIEGASHDARAAAVQFFSERIAYRVTEGVKP